MPPRTSSRARIENPAAGRCPRHNSIRTRRTNDLGAAGCRVARGRVQGRGIIRQLPTRFRGSIVVLRSTVRVFARPFVGQSRHVIAFQLCHRHAASASSSSSRWSIRRNSSATSAAKWLARSPQSGRHCYRCLARHFGGPPRIWRVFAFPLVDRLAGRQHDQNLPQVVAIVEPREPPRLRHPRQKLSKASTTTSSSSAIRRNAPRSLCRRAERTTALMIAAPNWAAAIEFPARRSEIQRVIEPCSDKRFSEVVRRDVPLHP